MNAIATTINNRPHTLDRVPSPLGIQTYRDKQFDLAIYPHDPSRARLNRYDGNDMVGCYFLRLVEEETWVGDGYKAERFVTSVRLTSDS